jgi:molybdopterin/thiamine biosynthesis adenylyltransferase/rhodanese-related sulfurtransferase
MSREFLKGVDLGREELTRYSRHILLDAIGIEGQQKLKAARILLVGVGGLGCPAAQYLVAAGVGCVGLVDSDIVELTNLQRQILYTSEDIGRPKVEAAAHRLRAMNPMSEIDALNLRLNACNADQLVDQYDLVIDASDNFATRTIVNQACLTLSKPLVYGSVYKFEGQVSIFVPGHGPCYSCVFPEVDDSASIRNCSELGVIGALPGIIGTMQATEAIKYLLGIGLSLQNRLLHFDALTMRWDEFGTAKRADCSACAAESTRSDAAFGAESGVEPQISVKALLPVELQKMRQANQPHLLIDVRTENESSICKIHGSILIPLSELNRRIGELPRQIPIVLMCKTGVRSLSAAKLLQTMGYEVTMNLSGGILAWIKDVDSTLSPY